jgi:hypothetical protein
MFRLLAIIPQSKEIMPSLIKGVTSTTTTTKQNVDHAVYYVYFQVRARG